MDGNSAEIESKQELARIDAPMERRRVGDMTVSKWAGLTFSEYREAIEFAKLMAQAKNSVPGYLKLNPGDCLAIVTQALRWHLEPYWVAQHSYVAKADGLIAYDSAVHAAIVLSSGMLKMRPRYSYAGEGDARTCTVSAVFVGENEALTYTTPPLSGCRKNSPLWKSDPDQQLGYFAIRNWGRRHCPELLGGVYDKDELEVRERDEEVIEPDFERVANPLAEEKPAIEAKPEPTPEKKPRQRRVKDKANEETQAAPETRTEAVAEAKVQEAKPVEQVPMPRTAPQYKEHMAAWLSAATTVDAIEIRWRDERKLRGDCSVIEDDFAAVKEMKERRVAELNSSPR